LCVFERNKHFTKSTIFDKNGLDYILGDFFTNYSGHPDRHVQCNSLSAPIENDKIDANRTEIWREWKTEEKRQEKYERERMRQINM
jgi:hypothetical protein